MAGPALSSSGGCLGREHDLVKKLRQNLKLHRTIVPENKEQVLLPKRDQNNTPELPQLHFIEIIIALEKIYH